MEKPINPKRIECNIDCGGKNLFETINDLNAKIYNRCGLNINHSEMFENSYIQSSPYCVAHIRYNESLQHFTKRCDNYNIELKKWEKNNKEHLSKIKSLKEQIKILEDKLK